MQKGTDSDTRPYSLVVQSVGRQMRFAIYSLNKKGSPWGNDGFSAAPVLQWLGELVQQVDGVEYVVPGHVTSGSLHFRANLCAEGGVSLVQGSIEQIVAALFAPPEHA